MANRLNMARIQAIKQLKTIKWSQRRIARELGIDRGTVARHLRQAENGANAAISPAGNSGSNAATFPPAPGTFSENSGDSDFSSESQESNAAISPSGSQSPNESDLTAALAAKVAAGDGEKRPVSAGRPSHCEPYREIIEAKLAAQLTAQRIWQDLAAEHGFSGKYDSVKRFVRRLARRRPLPMRRMETAAGMEAQVDFGGGARIILPNGKRRKSHVFRIVLGYSRKAYSESTFTQTTDDFLLTLENAFHDWGGVPKTLVIDNLKAAVAHPDWFDPVLTPKVQSFCLHYALL